MKLRLVSAPYIVWMAVFVVAPLVLVVLFSFTSDSGSFTLEHFARMGQYVSIFTDSLLLAVLATGICLVMGYPVAYILNRADTAVRRVGILFVMLPMWMNFLLRTYSWMSLLEDKGFLNRLLTLVGLGPVHIINTDAAVVIGMVYNFLPFMILPIYSVIEKIDRRTLEAAQDLGANSYVVFRRIIFPLSLPGVLSGITMVFIPSVSTFVISRLLGGGKTLLLGDLIEMQFFGNAYNPHLGSAISLVMMIIVMVCMAVMNRFGEGEDEVIAL